MKNIILKLFIFSVCISILNLYLVYGFAVLNPTYDAWILSMSYHDILQHYLGWIFYRNSPWHFPIGLMDNLVYPYQVSIIYTDSIPIFAIFFKLLSPLLPETFQYFGIWALVSFVLTAFISTLIIYRLTNNFYYSILASIFFLLTPSIYARMFGHTALAGQWILLLGIYLCISKNYYTRFRLRIFWILTFSLAVCIHAYFVGMLCFLLLGYCFSRFFEDKKIFSALLDLILPVVFVLFIMYLLGAFVFVGNVETDGYGLYSANLNTLFRPWMPETLLSKISWFNSLSLGSLQYEGDGYLGLGVLLTALISFIYLIKSFLDKKIRFNADISIIIFVMFTTFLYAISNSVYFNETQVFYIELPQSIQRMCSIFRAGGRFIWLFSAILMVILFYYLFKINKYRLIILCILLVIQFLDLKNYYFSMQRAADIKHENIFLDQLPKEKQIMMCELGGVSSVEEYDKFYKLAFYAYKNNTSINDFNIARKNYELVVKQKEKILAELDNGVLRDDAIYVFSTDEYKKYENILNFKNIDGFMLGWK